MIYLKAEALSKMDSNWYSLYQATFVSDYMFCLFRPSITSRPWTMPTMSRVFKQTREKTFALHPVSFEIMGLFTPHSLQGLPPLKIATMELPTTKYLLIPLVELDCSLFDAPFVYYPIKTQISSPTICCKGKARCGVSSLLMCLAFQSTCL